MCIVECMSSHHVISYSNPVLICTPLDQGCGSHYSHWSPTTAVFLLQQKQGVGAWEQSYRFSGFTYARLASFPGHINSLSEHPGNEATIF